MQTPTPADLKAVFGLPPEKAIDYFRAKGYAISWNWRDVWQESQAKAFTVARATQLDLLQDIRGALDQALANGTTLREFEKQLTPILQAKGWWGPMVDKATGEVTTYDGTGRPVELGSPRRLKTIYQTNLQTAYMAGRYQDFLANTGTGPGKRNYWQYVAVMDNRTRPSHAALNGLVFRYDDPVWDVIWPPNGFNCRCRVRARSESDITQGGLSVSKSEGHLKTVQVPDRNGVDQPRVVLNLPGMPKAFSPDPGWAYNPGKAGLEPFTPPPLDNLPATFQPGISLPDLPKPLKIARSDLLPAGLSNEEYARQFLSKFDADIGKPQVFKDVTGEPLVISEDLFLDGAGEWKITKDGRAPYLLLLADTIQTPSEIWLRWEESHDSPGTWLLKRRYIKSFELDDGLFGLGIFERGNEGWSGSTVFMPRPDRSEQARRNYIEKQRDGFLQYRK